MALAFFYSSLMNFPNAFLAIIISSAPAPVKWFAFTCCMNYFHFDNRQIYKKKMPFHATSLHIFVLFCTLLFIFYFVNHI